MQQRVGQLQIDLTHRDQLAEILTQNQTICRQRSQPYMYRYSYSTYVLAACAAAAAAAPRAGAARASSRRRPVRSSRQPRGKAPAPARAKRPHDPVLLTAVGSQHPCSVHWLHPWSVHMLADAAWCGMRSRHPRRRHPSVHDGEALAHAAPRGPTCLRGGAHGLDDWVPG
jgi:hypothetical protein